MGEIEVALHPGAAEKGAFPCGVGCGQDGLDPGADGFGGYAVEEDAVPAILENVASRAGAAADHGHLERERLEEDDAESFEGAGKDEDVGLAPALVPGGRPGLDPAMHEDPGLGRHF